MTTSRTRSTPTRRGAAAAPTLTVSTLAVACFETVRHARRDTIPDSTCAELCARAERAARRLARTPAASLGEVLTKTNVLRVESSDGQMTGPIPDALMQSIRRDLRRLMKAQ